MASFAEPTVDDGDGNVTLRRFSQEVWPDFEFNEADGIGSNAIEESPNGTAGIERIPDDLAPSIKQRLRSGKTRVGRGGDHRFDLGLVVLQLID